MSVDVEKSRSHNVTNTLRVLYIILHLEMLNLKDCKQNIT